MGMLMVGARICCGEIKMMTSTLGLDFGFGLPLACDICVGYLLFLFYVSVPN